VALDSATIGISCPDPGHCQTGTGQQLDEFTVTLCAGPTGLLAVNLQPITFSAGPDLPFAAPDPVTDDTNVPSALGTYNFNLSAGQCTTGDLYFDILSGSNWELQFAYYASAYDTATYIWESSAPPW
jgi:hypothetical protein